jgi:hypothetical protein
VERDFPWAIHSLVLDSALPPSVNQVTNRVANAERAFGTLFAGCAADRACAAAYPELETVFYEGSPHRYDLQRGFDRRSPGSHWWPETSV